MAISANAVWEVRAGGSDSNGGGFVTGASGTDFSQQNAAQFALTGIATSGAGATFLTASAAASMVGNICQVISGTNFTPGFYQIISVSVGVSVTVDSNLATGVGASGVINIGGALFTPGKVAEQIEAGVIPDANVVYIKNEGTTFDITTATDNVAGGFVNTGVAGITWVGYSTNRNPSNADSKPTIKATVNGSPFGFLLGIGANSQAININCDGNSQTAIGCVGSQRGTFVRCTFQNTTTVSFGAVHIGCRGIFNTFTPFASGSTAYFCEAMQNSSSGFSGNAFHCLAYANTGSGFEGGGSANCVAYSNGVDGFTLASGAVAINCIAEDNFAYGFNGQLVSLIYCTGFGNISGLKSATVRASIGDISVSGSVFVSAPGNDFSLNNTAGRGALLRGLGFQALYPGGVTAAYLDVGAAQHQDSGGSAGMLFIPNLEGI